MNVDIIWAKFLERIKNDVNSMVYKAYFANTKLLTIEDNKLIISVPNIICQKRLDTIYYDIITALLSEITEKNYELKFILEEEASKIIKPKQESLFDNYPQNNVYNFNKKDGNETLVYKHQSNLRKDYTFDNFIVGNSNRFAHGVAFGFFVKVIGELGAEF